MPLKWLDSLANNEKGHFKINMEISAWNVYVLLPVGFIENK
jgi:hypothetical protein